ncbi:hypothetical protein ACQ856_18225 [Mycolicibacterium psychrotolerans]|uniref:hypothetical protein n=1 Tax=Mycolicibacterium psychrotolerans TaxID=216929 RepID=UPI003D678361
MGDRGMKAAEAWTAAGAVPGVWITMAGVREVCVDVDGTRWRISQFNTSGWITLTCQFRDIRLTSQHPSPEAAKRHRIEIRASWAARTMREYEAAVAPAAAQEGMF